MVINDRLFC